MKKFTSASASKYLRMLEEEKKHILDAESETSTYTRTADEAVEPPAYDYAETRARIERINEATRKIRHALHMFNSEATIEFDGSDTMTIDEALIYLAQLNNEKNVLLQMRNRRPKERLSGGWRSEIIEYRYANYDVEAVDADYRRLVSRISDLQLAIDLANQTETFEVDIEDWLIS